MGERKSNPCLPIAFMETVKNTDDPHLLYRRSNGQDLRWKMGFSGDDDCEEEEFDGEVWKLLIDGVGRVQSVLDQNTALIQQVNENHLSKNPVKLAKNAALIRELNGNISKILSIYSGISSDFTNLVRQRKLEDFSNGGKEVVDRERC